MLKNRDLLEIIIRYILSVRGILTSIDTKVGDRTMILLLLEHQSFPATVSMQLNGFCAIDVTV